MKLQAQYNRITLFSSLFIILIAGIGYYFLLRYVLVSQLDETLKVEEAEINDYVRENDKLPPPTVYKDQRISFATTNKSTKRSFASVVVFDAATNKKESSRQLLFPVELHGQYYVASVTKSEESTRDLVWIILFSTTALVVLLAVVLFFMNRFLIKKLWQPFHSTLSSIKEFNLSAPGTISSQETKITEFRELNESIRMMAQKVSKDYQALKDFTDHASHEMQTPLAIINSKLDVLIQEPELSERSMQQVQGIYNAVEKLSRLCQSLLLLTRIENNQFGSTELLCIDEMIREKKDEMQELANASGLKIDMFLDPLRITMNRELADILISNLLGNAIRHNEPGGQILIQTVHNELCISNSGKVALDKNKIVARFYKSDNSKGTGLGLAIVQQICDQYHFGLHYSFNNGQHYFRIVMI